MLQQNNACVRQFRAAGMTHEKLNLQLLFQLANLEPEGRLRDPQNLCGLCEAFLFAHSNEIHQLPDIHAILMVSQIVFTGGM
ncbi:MAG TPA: hypothetical protein VGM72_04890 [Micropepsaceae bacterium]